MAACAVLPAADSFAKGEGGGDGQLVDIKVVPVISAAGPRPLHGGWRAAILILGAVAATNVGSAGIFLNLVLYLTDVCNRTNAAAANIVTNVNGTMFCFAVVGALVSDAYLGRFGGCTTFLSLYFLGSAAFTALVAISGTASASSWQWVSLNLSLYVAGIGYGAFEPPLSAFAGDQLATAEEKGVLFNLFFVLSNVGQGVALIILSSLQYAGMWALGFGIGTATTAMGLLLFLAGTGIFKRYRPGGNSLEHIAQVLVAATRKTNLGASQVVDGSEDGMPASTLLCQAPSTLDDPQLVHTDRFRWLDNAAVKDGGPGGKWHLCSVAQVEEVKCLLSVFPIWLTGGVYNVAVAQLSTVFTEQGVLMGQPSWLTIPPTSMQVFNIATNILFAMVYDVVITRLRQAKGVSQLQRMGAGLLVAVASMLVAGCVETVRLLLSAQDLQISLFWLVPQYSLVGVSQVLMVVAQMEFFYSEVSSSMRSLGSCLPLLARAFGNYLSTVIVDILTSLTTHNGSPGWISQDLNQGHLNYFYWTIAGILAIDLLVFLRLSCSYKYLEHYQAMRHSQ